MSVWVSLGPVFEFLTWLWFQPWFGQGTNCRFFHTFADEDAMRWLKGALDVEWPLFVCGTLGHFGCLS